MTITFQALSLVEKAEPVQVCFTLCLRDQRSMWMQDGCKVYMDGFRHGIEWIMFHGHLEYFQEPPLGSRPNTKPGRPWHSESSQPLVYSILSYVRTHMNKTFIEVTFGWEPGHIWFHTTLEGPWPHYMILEVCWDSLWTLSFGLSQFHGHGSWLVCEVALSVLYTDNFLIPLPTENYSSLNRSSLVINYIEEICYRSLITSEWECPCMASFGPKRLTKNCLGLLL